MTLFELAIMSTLLRPTYSPVTNAQTWTPNTDDIHVYQAGDTITMEVED